MSESGKEATRRRAGESPSVPTVALVSLGCPKNLVDSEAMALILEECGFRAAGGVREADVLVVNTCSFVKEATAESAEQLEEALRLKREGTVGKVVAAGCLVQKLGRRILDEFPDVDAAVGTGSWHKVGEVCRRSMSGGGREIVVDPPGSEVLPSRRKRSSHGHFAYLKITEGCHRRCSYCVIPSLRGPLRSLPPDILLREAKRLTDGGAAELVLVGEDIGAYGADADGRWNLAELLRELNRESGAGWIRMLYVHPASVSPDLVAAAEDCERVCAYIDVPIQHAADSVLSRMKRPTTRRDLERVMKMLKTSPKGFALRTTVMVGFPGETASDFEELKSFVREWEFDHLGAFCYSPEAGTEAAAHSEQIDGAVKEDRMREIMKLQSEISHMKNEATVGSVADVIVDARRDDELLLGRTQRQAPEVDGLTMISGAYGAPGDFLTVRVMGADDYDLRAVPLRRGRS